MSDRRTVDQAADSLEIRLLGPLEVIVAGRQIDAGAGKQRALIALLALRAGEVVPTDRVIDALWDERPPASALNSVHVYVSHLRKALGSHRIVTRGRGYSLALGPEHIDAHRFERLLQDGRKRLTDGEADEAASVLRDALELWRGPALADLASEPALRGEIARLEELRLAALEERLEADLARGCHAELVPELEALVRDNPLRERLRGALMLALYRSGRQPAALDAYRRGRTMLAAELGLEPGRALQELERAILRQDSALDLPGRPTGKSGRRSRRRVVVVGAVIAVLVAAAVSIGLFAFAGGDDGSPVVVGNSLVRIDARTLEPTDVVPVTGAPDIVVAAGGYLWVTHHVLRDEESGEPVQGGGLRDAGERTLTRVDPATGETRIVGGGLAPCGLAADPSGDVWVANCFVENSGRGANVLRVDAASLEFGPTWPVPGGNGFFRGLAYGDGWLWLSDVRGGEGTVPERHRVIRIDPRTGEERSIAVEHPPGPLAWAEGYGELWMSNFLDGTVSRLHPATRSVRTLDVTPAWPALLAVHGDTAWLPDWYSPRLVRVAAGGPMRAHSVRLSARTKAGVWIVTAGAGYVWATTPRAGAIWRVDPATNQVTRIAVPHVPTGVAVVDGGVWVSVRKV